eukprot:GGOE01014806.1.p3 GENE.GGOE01014806.1~~GGOE01014806.1.p3  ORF type:complete len:146 (-),score=51.01 GGOE01014806.1:209-610(-)
MTARSLKADIARLMSSGPSLALVDEGVGSKGAKFIAEHLKENCSVTELDLEFNDIGTAGAVLLFAALRSNTTLTALHLPNNGIDRGCLPAVRKFFATNHTLKELTLTGNDIEEDEEAMEVIAAALERNAAEEQ